MLKGYAFLGGEGGIMPVNMCIPGQGPLLTLKAFTAVALMVSRSTTP